MVAVVAAVRAPRTVSVGARRGCGSLFPIAYFVYALARGHFDGNYPYPFIDVGKLGWLQVAMNAAGIALGFIICRFPAGVDRRMAPAWVEARQRR